MTKIVCVVNDEAKTGLNLKREHGLSFWIETQEHVVLLDTGQSPQVLSHNLAMVGLSPQRIEALALSHAHYDHTGGLDVILSTGKDIPLYALTDLFRPRYALREGEYKEIGISHSKSELSKYITLRLSDDPVEIVSNLWTTGEIRNRPERVGGSDHLLIKTVTGWKPDPYRDDMSLVLKTFKGLVLICGCCHAGILNTLYHVEKVFGANVVAVIGGTHLVSADELYMDHVMAIIQDRWSDCKFYLNHCTGKQAFQKMQHILAGQVRTCPAGTAINY